MAVAGAIAAGASAAAWSGRRGDLAANSAGAPVWLAVGGFLFRGFGNCGGLGRLRGGLVAFGVGLRTVFGVGAAQLLSHRGYVDPGDVFVGALALIGLRRALLG